MYKNNTSEHLKDNALHYTNDSGLSCRDSKQEGSFDLPKYAPENILPVVVQQLQNTCDMAQNVKISRLYIQ